MPTMVKFDMHKCRLRCVYEDNPRLIQVRRKIVFDDSVIVVLLDESELYMKEDVVYLLLQWKPGGGVIYSLGLNSTEKILTKGSGHPFVNVKRPVAIFLSDGGNNGGEDPLLLCGQNEKNRG
ncbi:hypothetical protein SUGI_0679950 [Cryptomeria japonica]|nr:hypothetical protein SUGI_0679950 [Cryptomeria japonica]